MFKAENKYIEEIKSTIPEIVKLFEKIMATKDELIAELTVSRNPLKYSLISDGDIKVYDLYPFSITFIRNGIKYFLDKKSGEVYLCTDGIFPGLRKTNIKAGKVQGMELTLNIG